MMDEKELLVTLKAFFLMKFREDPGSVVAWLASQDYDGAEFVAALEMIN